MSSNMSISIEKLNEDLWNAFEKENTTRIRLLIEHGANPNYYGPIPQKKRSLLHKGAEDGKVEIVKVLLENGADPNMRDLHQRTPLHFAAENGHTDVVRLLLEHKADVSATDMRGVNALILAANVDIFELLISNGIDIKSTDKKGQTALHIAALKGKCDIVKTLLKHGADHSAKDNDGNTPILNAINNGHNDVVKALIDAGVNIREGVLFYGQYSTLLHHAVAAKNVEVVKTLLDHGHPVDAVNGENWRAFDSACVDGCADIVELMLSRGANVNHVHGIMQTVPLHHTGPHYEVLEVLLKHKDINVNAQDRDGRTPIYHAAGKGFIGNFLLLLKYGAELNTENINKIDYNPLLVAFNESRQFHEQLKKQNEELVQLKKGLKEKDVLGEMYHREIARKEAENRDTVQLLKADYLEQLKGRDEEIRALHVIIARLKKEAMESKLVNELEEPKLIISEASNKPEETEEKKKIELKRKNEIDNEVTSLKKSKLMDDDKFFTHDNDCDVSKLMVILQPLEDDWYQLGHHLDMAKSTLNVEKQLQNPSEQMEYLLQRWCKEGGTLLKLEKALTAMGRQDVILRLHDFKNDVFNNEINLFDNTSFQCDNQNVDELLTIGKKNVSYAANSEHKLILEDCGMNLFIPDGVVTPPDSFYQVAVQGLWGSEFILPEGANLISGVCHIAFSAHLIKPVTIQLEHCANIVHQDQVKYLSFVTANSEDKPPYQFQLISGGIFNVHTRYGTISLTSATSLLAIVMKDADDDTHDKNIIPNSFHRIHLYCKDIPPSPKKFKMGLAVSQDLKYCTQVVDKKSSSDLGREESSFQFQFAAGKKRLWDDDESDGTRWSKSLRLSNLPVNEEIIDGWRITPSQPSAVITESDINAFTQHDGKLPLIPLTIQPDPSANDFKSTLRYPLTIDGINDGSMDITINKSIEDTQEVSDAVIKSDVDIQFNYMTPFIDRLDNFGEVHKAGNKLFVVQGDGPQLLNWEKYGLKIGVAKGTLLPSETAEIAVVALVGGQFKFPKGTQLVSAVYAISFSKPLNEPLRVDMQHCVNITRPSQTRKMKFAIAPLNISSPPYQFEVVEGGEFTVNSFYGSIHRQKFCLVGILTGDDNHPAPDPTQSSQLDPQAYDEEVEEDNSSLDNDSHEREELNGSIEGGNSNTSRDDESQMHIKISSEDEKKVMSKPVQSLLQESTADISVGAKLLYNYTGMLFYEERRIVDFVTFVAVKNLNALIEYIKNYHPQAEIGQTVQFKFQSSSNYIRLKFDEKSINGWIIQPLIEPCDLLQEKIDDFGNKQSPIPAFCRISVYGSVKNDPDIIPVLHCGVTLEGADPPVTIFIHRELRTTSNTSTTPPLEAPPSSSGFQPTSSTKKNQIDINKLIQVIKGVLQSHHADLTGLPEESHQDLADRLFASSLISNAVKNKPTMNKCIHEFGASLNWLKSQSVIQSHCIKFLKGFIAVGGSYSIAAEVLKEDLIEAVNNKLHVDFNLNVE